MASLYPGKFLVLHGGCSFHLNISCSLDHPLLLAIGCFGHIINLELIDSDGLLDLAVPGLAVSLGACSSGRTSLSRALLGASGTLHLMVTLLNAPLPSLSIQGFLFFLNFEGVANQSGYLEVLAALELIYGVLKLGALNELRKCLEAARATVDVVTGVDILEPKLLQQR